MPYYPEHDEPREDALEAAERDPGEASTVEEVAAALEAIRQVPVDVDQVLNAIRVPDDAGEYEAPLRKLPPAPIQAVHRQPELQPDLGGGPDVVERPWCRR